MRIYSLSCGHSDSGTHSIGVMTMCPTCLCYARIMQVSSEWPETPNSDAIVNMVFDAIHTWNTRAPIVGKPPIDLTAEVKARFREALRLNGQSPPDLKEVETLRKERDRAQARVGSLALDVKNRNERVRKLEDGLREIRETLRTPPLGFASIDMNSLIFMIGRILQ